MQSETLTCRANGLELSVSDDGSGLTLRSPAGVFWRLDEETLLADHSGLPDPVQFSADPYRCVDNEAVSTASRPRPFTTASAHRLGESALQITRRGAGGTLVTLWE